MTTQLQIRIKASDKESAMKQVGGRVIYGKCRMFAFDNQSQRDEYDRIRRRLEREDGTPTVG